jgi:hypothetical protein
VENEAMAGPPAPRAPLCARVAALCGQIRFREPHLNDQLTSLVRALHEPLRVAFAGRVSMGKSTLVNALLQAPVAPTGAGETTRVVTRFEAGDFERVDLRLRDGAKRQAFLTPTGVLPPAYPVPVAELQEVRVRLPYAPLLRRVTLIDTPGLESLNEAASGRTNESLFSRDSRTAIADADALVYLTRTGTEDDAIAVAAFNELTALDLCALNAVGVINCKTEHSLSEQDRVARRLKGEPAFHNRVADIIPVAGLLAYAAGSALLDYKDAGSLRTLAGDAQDDLLIDAEEFLEAPCDVARDDRQRLLGMLGLPGLRIALEAIRASTGDLAAINAALLGESGLPRLLRVIDGTFANCADQIKAGQTLVAVTRLSWQADVATGHRARVLIETLRAEPEMHGIQEFWALRQCARSDLDLPDWMAAELARIAAAATPWAKTGLPEQATAAEILDAAREGASRAHAFAAKMAVVRPEARVAETLRRSYTNVYRDMVRDIQGPPG